MSKVIYPGSFDPITYGHLDIIERSSKLFDHLIIAVIKNNDKTDFLLTQDERVALIEESVSRFKNVID